ncbi:MAG: alpha/beta hydrolase-fold protein [Wenzhouxiangella sp.]|nr:alpha/beta hydrolase-fold protein [Wenzhouxiangella sp.]
MHLAIRTLLLAWLAASGTVLAKTESAELDRLFGLGPVETFTIHSETLGRDFHVYVRLPRAYGETDCRWPVVYLLDGGILFPMLAPLQLMMELDELAPQAVLVGISYGGLGFANGNLRATDYTAPAPEAEYFGGADDYQNFLADELIPRVSTNYRVDHDHSLVLGQSLGGQFTLYTALTRPALFAAYLSINPALHRNVDFFLELDAAVRSAPAPILITRASEDGHAFRMALDRWLDHWEAGQSSALDLSVSILEGQHHASSAPAAYLHAMAWWAAQTEQGDAGRQACFAD